MNVKKLNGSERKADHLTAALEKRFLDVVLPIFPKSIRTYHLTLTTLILSFLAIIIGYVSRSQRTFLLLNSPILVIQYFADLLDGAVGRFRETGLVKWGFYMDHLVDFVFACSLLASFSLAFHMSSLETSLTIIIAAVIYVDEYLATAILSRTIQTSGYFGVGVTEIRAILIVFNILVFPLALELQQWVFRFLMGFMAAVATLLVFKRQKQMWSVDMVDKNKN